MLDADAHADAHAHAHATRPTACLSKHAAPTTQRASRKPEAERAFRSGNVTCLKCLLLPFAFCLLSVAARPSPSPPPPTDASSYTSFCPQSSPPSLPGASKKACFDPASKAYCPHLDPGSRSNSGKGPTVRNPNKPLVELPLLGANFIHNLHTAQVRYNYPQAPPTGRICLLGHIPLTQLDFSKHVDCQRHRDSKLPETWSCSACFHSRVILRASMGAQGDALRH